MMRTRALWTHSTRSLAVLPWVGGEVADRAHCQNVDDLVIDGMLVIAGCWRCAASWRDRVWGGMLKDAVRAETLGAASDDCAWASETKCGRQRGAWACLGIWYILRRP
jgi:hypothetical protein